MNEPTSTPTKLFRDWHAATTGTPFFAHLVKPAKGRAARCWPGDEEAIKCVRRAIHPWLYEIRPIFGAQHDLQVVVYDADQEDKARAANAYSQLGCMIRFGDIYGGCIFGRIGDIDAQNTVSKAAPSRVIRLQQAQRWGIENRQNPWYKVFTLAMLVSNSERTSLTAVLMHEFGHLLGLGHPTRRSSVMWVPQLERDPTPLCLEVGWKAPQFLNATDSAIVARMLQTLSTP